MRRWLILLPVLLLPFAAGAQQQSVEDRLREALRSTMVDLRALQDNQAALQAQLQDAQKQRDAAQQQVQDLTAKAQPAPSPQAPAVPPEALQKLQAELDALKRDDAAARAGLAHWQAAYQQAARLAQSKDGEARALDTRLHASDAALAVAMSKNTQLIAVARDILHLYRTQGFRAILLGSYEPLIGTKQVQLENMVQDYEDRIRAERYFPATAPAASP